MQAWIDATRDSQFIVVVMQGNEGAAVRGATAQTEAGAAVRVLLKQLSDVVAM
jgi:hypothetical protein